MRVAVEVQLVAIHWYFELITLMYLTIITDFGKLQTCQAVLQLVVALSELQMDSSVVGAK